MDLKESGERMPQQIAFKETTTGFNVVLFVRNIIYIGKYKDSHHSFVYYQDAYEGKLRCVTVRITLSELNDILPNMFIMVNRSNIINQRYILSYNDVEVNVWTPEGLRTFAHKYDVSQRIIEL